MPNQDRIVWEMHMHDILNRLKVKCNCIQNVFKIQMKYNTDQQNSAGQDP